MSYLDKRSKIDLLQQQIDAHGELKAEVKKKINYKFRLDWNYYSNSMEGNTLTMAETRSVMVGNLTVGGKPIKDVLEIKGHDEVISEIMKVGKGEVRLSEARIREIHQGIMHEEDEAKRKKIGGWKTEPNYLYNYKGERVDFALPQEVPALMHELLNKTNAAIDAIIAKKKDAPHPIDVALSFHLDYVIIHPFYDGNGRTARILTNLILISFGYPPFWVKEGERVIYSQYIGDVQAYGGNPDLFYEFCSDLILRSQQLVLDAIEGKSIEEEGDLDKKISMLERELDAVDPNEIVQEYFNNDVFIKIYNSWFSDLVMKVVPAVQKFNKFFKGTGHYINLANGAAGIEFINDPAKEILEKLAIQVVANKDTLTSKNAKISFFTNYGALIKGGLKTFGCNYGFEIRFEQIKYEVFIDEFSEDNEIKHTKFYEKLLHQPLSPEEIDAIVSKLTNSIYEHIDFHTKKSGLR
ncbi:MAG: Fic family protein [Bacteroidetes bacterium]|nr:Fic family protein [Bacteroidota bacterium]